MECKLCIVSCYQLQKVFRAFSPFTFSVAALAFAAIFMIFLDVWCVAQRNDVFVMKNAQELSAEIRKQAKSKRIPIKKMLSDCELNANYSSQISDKKVFLISVFAKSQTILMYHSTFFWAEKRKAPRNPLVCFV